MSKTYDFLLKKMGVPDSLKPQIVSVPQNERIGMAYNFLNNQLNTGEIERSTYSSSMVGYRKYVER